MKIVLDTNILLTCISERSTIHDIFLAFLDEKYDLCVTTEILSEYEEVISRHMGQVVASNLLSAIENATNVTWVTRYFAWRLINIDPDDNKFVDCAIAANAHFLVSEDGHFDILEGIPFPRVEVLNVHAFQEILRGDSNPEVIVTVPDPIL